MVKTIQYLRFFAAILVVLTHAFESVPRIGRGDLGASFSVGQIGVDIFFVISGFIMASITESREQSALEFLKRRFARIAPPYWIATGLFALTLYLKPELFRTSELHLDHTVASLLFFAWPHPIMGDALPLFLPGWTLNAEVLFYVLFALSQLISIRHRMSIVSTLLLFFVILGFILKPDNQIIAFYCRPILLEFIFGILAYKIFSRYPDGNLTLRVAPLMLAMAVISFQILAHPVSRISDDRIVFWGIPAMLVVVAALAYESTLPDMPLLKRLGDASYSLYLTHFFVIGLLAKLWGAASLSRHVSDGLFIIAVVGVSIIVGYMFFLVAERPSVKAATRLLTPRGH